MITYDASLKVETIKFKKNEPVRGVFDRAKLNKIFVDYIYAYLYTAKQKEDVLPTMMFILSDNTDPGAIIAVPFNLPGYTQENIEGFVALLLEQYPEKDFQLEMVMYSRFDPDFLSSDKYKIMFGARDSSGAFVHSVYIFERTKGKQDNMTHYKMTTRGFDQWVQPEKDQFEDKYLRDVLSTYLVLSSFRQYRLQHVK